MAKARPITLIYDGRDADQHRLNLYDASTSYYGLARTLAIIGHFYITGDIIAQAPRSALELYLVPPEEGSFKQTVLATAAATIIAMPFTVFATRVMDNWIPQSNPQMEQMLELMREQNELLRAQQGLPRNQPTKKEAAEEAELKHCLKKYEKELQAIRSITSNSFKSIFRPVGRSADRLGIVGGQPQAPKAAVDLEILAKIEADEVDDKSVIFMAVVNSFSRSSKTGIVFSRDYDMGFRIEYEHKGRLPREDDFSWSQFTGEPLRLHGRFVRFFDGTIKKFLVFTVERVTDPDEVKEYKSNQREIRVP